MNPDAILGALTLYGLIGFFIAAHYAIGRGADGEVATVAGLIWPWVLVRWIVRGWRQL